MKRISHVAWHRNRARLRETEWCPCTENDIDECMCKGACSCHWVQVEDLQRAERLVTDSMIAARLTTDVRIWELVLDLVWTARDAAVAEGDWHGARAL
jgi:hypothetical protein